MKKQANPTAGNFRATIDPYAYTHRCNNEASYVPKLKYEPKRPWQRVTDTTGRGFGKSEGTAGITQMAIGAKNLHGFESLPRPTMESLLTQNAHNLDRDNRFFNDNKNTMEHFNTLQAVQKTSHTGGNKNDDQTSSAGVKGVEQPLKREAKQGQENKSPTKQKYTSQYTPKMYAKNSDIAHFVKEAAATQSLGGKDQKHEKKQIGEVDDQDQTGTKVEEAGNQDEREEKNNQVQESGRSGAQGVEKTSGVSCSCKQRRAQAIATDPCWQRTTHNFSTEQGRTNQKTTYRQEYSPLKSRKQFSHLAGKKSDISDPLHFY